MWLHHDFTCLYNSLLHLFTPTIPKLGFTSVLIVTVHIARYLLHSYWWIQETRGGHSLAPLHARRDEAAEEVVGAVVKRRHILPVVIDTESPIFHRIFQALHQTVYKVKAHVRSLLNRVVAVETTVKGLTMRCTSEDSQAGSKQED